MPARRLRGRIPERPLLWKFLFKQCGRLHIGPTACSERKCQEPSGIPRLQGGKTLQTVQEPGPCPVLHAQVLSLMGGHMPYFGVSDIPLRRSKNTYAHIHFCWLVLCCFYWIQHTSREMHSHKCTAQWIFIKRTYPLNKGKMITQTSRGPLSPSVNHSHPQASMLLISNSKFHFACSSPHINGITQHFLMYLAAWITLRFLGFIYVVACGLLTLLSIRHSIVWICHNLWMHSVGRYLYIFSWGCCV